MKQFFKITISLCVIFTLSSCGSKKIAATENSKEIVLPITNFTSDKTYIRSIANGTSPNMSMAKELAYTSATAEIAKSINAKIKSVLEDYATQSEIDSSIDFKSQVERMTTLSIDESIKNLKIAKEKVFQNPDKTFTYWLGVELNKEEIYNSISAKISNSKLKDLQKNKVEFRETFNKNFEE